VEKICFIVNPISGINRKPKKIVQWIKEIFQPSGKKFDIVYTRKPGDGTQLAREAVEKGYDLVVAVGGDGTINEVSQSLIYSKAALGVIPAGSGNGFARNFKIPLNQRRAIQILLSPQIIQIDAGKINNRYFFNVAGTGLDAEISKNFEQFGMRGPLPYFIIGARSFLKFQPTPVKVYYEQKGFEFSPLFISIANVPQYGNGAIIAPHARPDDGLLDVCILEDISLLRALFNVHRLFNGTVTEVKEFHTFQVKQMIIERSQSGPIHTDGNPYEEEAILKVEVIPKALHLALKPHSSSSENR